jgi:hypothetical protein
VKKGGKLRIGMERYSEGTVENRLQHQNVVIADLWETFSRIVNAVSQLPCDVVHDLCEDCNIIVAEDSSHWVPRDHIGDGGLIILAPVLAECDEEVAIKVILHEIAHFYLWSVDEDKANKLRDQWLNDASQAVVLGMPC